MKFLILLTLTFFYVDANEIKITKTSNAVDFKSKFNTVGTLKITTGIFLFSLQLDTSRYLETLDLLHTKGLRLNATMTKMITDLKKRSGHIEDLKIRQFVYREFISLQLTLGLIERSAVEHKLLLMNHLLTIESSASEDKVNFTPDELVYRESPKVMKKKPKLGKLFEDVDKMEKGHVDKHNLSEDYSNNDYSNNDYLTTKPYNYSYHVKGEKVTSQRSPRKKRRIVKPSISHLGRGVNSFTSYVYNALGIGSVGNVEDILKELDIMTTNQDELQKGVNKNIIALNATIEHVLGLEEDIETITSLLKHVQISMVQLMTSNTLLVSEINIAIQLLNLKVNFDSLNSKIEMFVEATQKLKNHGIISSNLITPAFVIRILSNLPQSQKDLFPVPLRLGNIPDLYKLADGMIFKRANDKVQLIISLPISDIHQHFLLYEALPIPVKVVDKDLYIKFEVESKYFGVDLQQSLYVLIPNIEKCKYANKMYLCPLEQSLITDDATNCLIKLYKRKKDLTACPYVFLRDFPPIFIREPHAYAYFVSEKGVDFQLNCPKKRFNHFQLKGSGKITVPQQCLALSSSVVLPSIFNINTGPVHIEEYENPLTIDTSFIDDDIANDVDFYDVLDQFNSSLNSHDGVSLKRIQEGLKHIKLKKRHEFAIKAGQYSVYSILSIILFITCLIFIYLKCHSCCNYPLRFANPFRTSIPSTVTSRISTPTPRRRHLDDNDGMPMSTLRQTPLQRMSTFFKRTPHVPKTEYKTAITTPYFLRSSIAKDSNEGYDEAIEYVNNSLNREAEQVPLQAMASLSPQPKSESGYIYMANTEAMVETSNFNPGNTTV